MRELLHQPAVAFCLFERGQVLALDILNERNLEGLTVVELANDDRDLVKLGELRRAPAALAGDDLVGAGVVRMATHQDRLQYAFVADRLGESLQRGLVEVAARLEPAGAHEI